MNYNLFLTGTFGPRTIGSKYSYVDYTKSTFPAGEVFFKINKYVNHLSQIVEPLSSDCVTIVSNPSTSEDVMTILMANDALKRDGIVNIDLFMPYVPYGRQDRVMNKGESLSIKIFTDLINSCEFNSVQIVDPHSSVTPALLNNCQLETDSLNYFYRRTFQTFLHTNESYTVIAPDAGAEKRCFSVINSLFYSSISTLPISYSPKNLAIGIKHRDPTTGDVSVSLAGQVIEKTAVIIDDICDGGRTFIELATKLRELHHVERIILVVTHGIFSKGMGVLSSKIDEVYSYNTTFNQFKIEQSAGNIIEIPPFWFTNKFVKPESTGIYNSMDAKVFNLLSLSMNQS